MQFIFNLPIHAVLVRISIAVKRHHGHGNSYKRKHFFGVAHFQFRGLAHYHQGTTWWHVGRHDAGAENPYILIQKQQEVVCLTGHGLSTHEFLKPIFTVIHFLQKEKPRLLQYGHTS